MVKLCHGNSDERTTYFDVQSLPHFNFSEATEAQLRRLPVNSTTETLILPLQPAARKGMGSDHDDNDSMYY